jgi:hypothetical protein
MCIIQTTLMWRGIAIITGAGDRLFEIKTGRIGPDLGAVVKKVSRSPRPETVSVIYFFDCELSDQNRPLLDHALKYRLKRFAPSLKMTRRPVISFQ